MASSSTVRAVDGTLLRAWVNGRGGVPVVISNGLGSPPAAWPAVTSSDSRFRTATWFHRGLGGSDRPAEASAIRVEDHAADLGSVMDAAGMDRALVVGWSVGVNVAFEFAQRHPERVAGILAVAGVPGGSFKAMFGSVGMPGHLREPVGVMSAYLLRVSGPWLSFLLASTPRAYHPALRISAQAMAGQPVHAGALTSVLAEFAGHDWDWYSRLVLAAGEHRPMDVSAVRCPVTLLGGRRDTITSSDDMRAVGRSIPGARVSVLASGNHFLPLQYPELMLDELRLLARRSSRRRAVT